MSKPLPRIPPRERFDRALIALDEGNQAEHDRLYLACPIVEQPVRDPAFVSLHLGSLTMTMLFAADWWRALARYQEVRRSVDLRQRYQETETEAPPWMFEETLETETLHLAQRLATLNALDQAFTQFCRAVHVPPDRALGAWQPDARASVAELRPVFEKAAADRDEASYRNLYEAMDSIWAVINEQSS